MDAPVQVCWIRKALPEEIAPGRVVTWSLVDAVTARSARGQGLYSRVMRAMFATAAPGEVCIGHAHDWNAASHRGILKAGFKPVAIRERRMRGGALETRWLPLP